MDLICGCGRKVPFKAKWVGLEHCEDCDFIKREYPFGDTIANHKSRDRTTKLLKAAGIYGKY